MPAANGADLAIVCADVWTLRTPGDRAEALAVRDGRIIHVGTTGEVIGCCGPETEVVDAGGRTVVPGLTDSHAHLDREGLREAYSTLRHCRSIADVQQVARRAAAGAGRGEWVVLLPPGTPPFHLDPAESLAERRYPDRWDLDAAVPDNPVWIRAIWGLWSNRPPLTHMLNSAALRAAGIDPRTPPPSSTTEIERTPGGELTGRILEHSVWPAAEYTLLSPAPRFDDETRRKALDVGVRRYLSKGTTSIYEGHGLAAPVIDLYRERYERGRSGVRAYLPLSPPPFASASELSALLRDWGCALRGQGVGDDRLRLGGIFLGYGGSAETAAIQRGAWPDTGWAGFCDQYNEPDAYRALCRIAAANRVRVNTIAGAGLDRILEVWKAVDAEYGVRDLRWVIAHPRRLTGRQCADIRRLGAVVTTIPASHLYRSGADLADELGCPDDELLPHRTLQRSGARWSLSTDNNPFDMLVTLWSAVTRTDMRTGRTVGPEQRLTVEEALRAVSYGGAYVSFAEGRRGTLTAGALADLVLLSRRLDPDDGDGLLDLDVDRTVVGGRTVYLR